MKRHFSFLLPFRVTSKRTLDLTLHIPGLRIPGLFALPSLSVLLAASATSLADDTSCYAVAPYPLLEQSVRITDPFFLTRHFCLPFSPSLLVGATGKSIPQMIVSGIFFGIASGIQETYYACLIELAPYKKRIFFIGKLVTAMRLNTTTYLHICARPRMRLQSASFGISNNRLRYYGSL